MKFKTINLLIGLKGESLAVKYLKGLGYKILEQNYKTHMGELDIIAKDKDRIVFVEVKSRSTLSKGFGREAVTQDKIRHLRSSATMYLKSKKLLDEKIRFDIIEIVDDKINHLKAVF